MSSVYESSYLTELDSFENFQVVSKERKEKLKSRAKKAGSAVKKGAKKAGAAAKKAFNWFGGWMRFIWIALVLMALFWVYKNFFA
jgi:hypothetical protein